MPSTIKGDPLIIMGEKDILKVHEAAPDAEIIVVHLDAINHMTVNRKTLAEYLKAQGIADHVLIPEDGESMHFANC